MARRKAAAPAGRSDTRLSLAPACCLSRVPTAPPLRGPLLAAAFWPPTARGAHFPHRGKAAQVRVRRGARRGCERLAVPVKGETGPPGREGILALPLKWEHLFRRRPAGDRSLRHIRNCPQARGVAYRWVGGGERRGVSEAQSSSGLKTPCQPTLRFGRGRRCPGRAAAGRPPRPPLWPWLTLPPASSGGGPWPHPPAGPRPSGPACSDLGMAEKASCGAGPPRGRLARRPPSRPGPRR